MLLNRAAISITPMVTVSPWRSISASLGAGLPAIDETSPSLQFDASVDRQHVTRLAIFVGLLPLAGLFGERINNCVGRRGKEDLCWSPAQRAVANPHAGLHH